jgi:4-hydroxy-tetrahydrodipicolinate synthase
MLKIEGVFSPALTPINEKFSINLDLYLSHCQFLLRQNMDGLAIFGTTGEANAFNVDEKISALEFLIDSNIKPNLLMPGTGQCSITDTLKLTKKCSNLKVRAVLVLPPFYYKGVSDEGIINYYKNIIERVGDHDLHYILYHIPQVSGVSITFNIIEKLIQLFPKNVIGMKDSSGDIDNMLKITKLFNGFSLFCGHDSLALKVVKHGGAGAITATSNISGRLLSFIINNYKDESLIPNFLDFQLLQEKIRKTLTTHEPISALKALMSVVDKNKEWNRVNPPLCNIDKPENHKTVISLIELIKEMDRLLPVF